MDNLEKLLYWKELGLTIREISEQTGIQSSTLRKRYSAAGIEYVRAPYGNTQSGLWDLSRLMNADDHDGQYVIGLLAADGYISNGRTVNIWVQEPDIELIYRILQVVGKPDRPIYRRKLETHKVPQVGIGIGSVELVNYLTVNYGFSNAKSRTIPFPNTDNPLPYLRGFFDGDGHMGTTCTFTTASPLFAIPFLEWIRKTYGFQPNIQMVGKDRDMYNMHFTRRHSQFIHDLMSYAGLHRKTIAYLNYLPN